MYKTINPSNNESIMLFGINGGVEKLALMIKVYHLLDKYVYYLSNKNLLDKERNESTARINKTFEYNEIRIHFTLCYLNTKSKFNKRFY